ncbi:MAG: prepilin peptidase [Methanosarcinales archaeon]|jgi:Flp pilus assembly protein protease CpaA|nr:prepilin peptidase [Methanosarcinales archaeon]
MYEIAALAVTTVGLIVMAGMDVKGRTVKNKYMMIFFGMMIIAGILRYNPDNLLLHYYWMWAAVRVAATLLIVYIVRFVAKIKLGGADLKLLICLSVAYVAVEMIFIVVVAYVCLFCAAAVIKFNKSGRAEAALREVPFIYFIMLGYVLLAMTLFLRVKGLIV